MGITMTSRDDFRNMRDPGRFFGQWLGLAALGAGGVMLAASIALAETPAPQAAAKPAARGGASTASVPKQLDGVVKPPTGAQPGEHPLLPVLRWAEKDLPAIEKIDDYSATFVRRERIRGKLDHYEYMLIKVRRQPFSIYGHFLGPASVKGQEVIYVAGQNQGRMWAHRPGTPVTFSLDPEGLLAMRGHHYPLTEIGLVNLVQRLVEVGKQDLKHDQCEVKYYTGAKVDKRVCTAIEVVHPEPRPEFRFHLARIFVDDQLKVPIRYESYGWPSEAGGRPKLMEEYTYLDLKLNNGLTDRDFSPQNPQYQFPAKSKVAPE
jgi:hypothetical protein